MCGRRGSSIDLFFCKIHISHDLVQSCRQFIQSQKMCSLHPGVFEGFPTHKREARPFDVLWSGPVRQSIRAAVREAMLRGRIGHPITQSPDQMQGLDAPSWTHRGEMLINSSEKLSRPFRPPYGEIPLDTLTLARPGVDGSQLG